MFFRFAEAALNGRIWTPDDSSQLRRLVQSGLTDGQIGERMGRERTAICRKRHELGIERGISPAMVSMMARINLRRRFRAMVAA